MCDEDQVKANLERMRQRFGRTKKREEAPSAAAEVFAVASQEKETKKSKVGVAQEETKKNSNTLVVAEEEQEGDLNETDTGSYTVVHVDIVSEILRFAQPLLSVWEKQQLEAFLALSDKSQKLFVRLLGRKYRLFRCSSLQLEAEEALLELQKSGFLSLVSGGLAFYGSKHRAIAFLRLLRVSELRTVAASISVVGRAKMTRDQLLECLSDACVEEDSQQQRRSSSSSSSDQSTLSFAAIAGKQKKNAAAIESAVCKVLLGWSASTPDLQKQSSLLAFWGGKQKSCPDPPPADEPVVPAMISAKWISANGFAAVLSHNVCAL